MGGIFFILMPAWLYTYTYIWQNTFVISMNHCWYFDRKYLIGSNQFWPEILPIFVGLYFDIFMKHWQFDITMEIKKYLVETVQYTISDVCSTDWQKKDSAFLSSVAFL
jgi:hypothetical protein